MKRHAPHNSFRTTQARAEAAPLVRRKKVTAALLAVGLAVLVAQTRGGAFQDLCEYGGGCAVPYERGFLVTGNYRVGGVDFTSDNVPNDGFATGQILFNTNAVPAGSEIVAASLYWEAVYAAGSKPTQGVKFRGQVIDPGAQWDTGPALGGDLVLSGPNADTNPVPGLAWATIETLPNATASCWGAAGGPTARLTTFKFDVLHLLPKLLDANNHWTGRRLVNDADLTTNVDENGVAYGLHTVTLPESTAVRSAGAALVVVYRNPSEPLTKVVMYDGAFTGAELKQTLMGFFQHTGNAGQLTHLVGTGGDIEAGSNETEQLSFNGTNLATNPFQFSPISDRSWAFPTFQNLSMSGVTSEPGYGGRATTAVTYQPDTPNDCATWSAIIFSTPVLDADQDGLPDALEASSTSGGFAWRNPDGPDTIADPSGQTLPNTLLPDINAMGARTGRKDILVEVNALYTNTATPYGHTDAPYDSAKDIESVTLPVHTHMPDPEALKMVGDAFLAKGIHVHFDVGPNLAAAYAADIATFAALQGTPLPTDPANKYIATSELAQPHSAARGGETLLETTCTPSEDDDPCHFQHFPGTVGYKLGLELIRNAPVKDDGSELITETDANNWDAAQAPSTTKRRRFDALRAPFVRYGLYAHARGTPKLLPCLKDGIPTTYPGGTSSCGPYADNPAWTDPLNDQRDYFVPTGSSGIGELPGGNFMVTLGLWDALTGRGTTYSQGATTFHELGHNLNLWHGGVPANLGQKIVGAGAPGTATFIEPNCKPNHQTTMSYMFQVHGLATATGAAVLDYSDTLLGDLNEATGLADGKFSVIPKYRPSWFAPANSALATTLGASAATRFCNGVKFNELDPPSPPTPAMARVWVSSPSTSNPPDWDVPINWNGDGDVSDTGTNLNVNFDGVFGSTQTLGLLNEADDWANIRLDQIGAGSNVVVRRLDVDPDLFPLGVSTLTSGDTLGGDTLGGDTLGGDTLGGDTLGGDTLGGDTLGGDTLGGDTLGGDTLGGDTLGGDTLGGDTLGGDTLGGDTLGGDTLGGAELDKITARDGLGRGDTRAFQACRLGGSGPNGCTGPWFDGTGFQVQPSPGDPMYLKIYVTWFGPTSEPTFTFQLTASGGGAPVVITLNPEDIHRQPGDLFSAIVTDHGQLPANATLTFSVNAKLDDLVDGPVSAPSTGVPPATLYLHGNGIPPLPGTLFLDDVAPLAPQNQSKRLDSPPINFNGGNLWKVVGTPLTLGGDMIPAAVYVYGGLKNSDDTNTAFDLRVLNAAGLQIGLQRCIKGLRNGVNLAKLITLENLALGEGGALSITLETRIGTNPNGSRCSGPDASHSNATGLRVWFDSTTRASKVVVTH